MNGVKGLSQVTTKLEACEALGVPRGSYYRWLNPRLVLPKPRKPPPRSLKATERQEVLNVLNSSRFADQSPAAAYSILLDEGTYRCSIRTMYRILEENGQVRERRNQLRHPSYKKPELLATGPNQVWSWDITKLRGPAKWTYYYLYVIIDIYSRYVVGWVLARNESGALAKRLIQETADKHGIAPDRLTIHSDRGPSMGSKQVAQLIADLGATKTHSRPHVPNDNPYSESQFKTMKYRPEFPSRFGSFEDSLGFCRVFFRWYNQEHRHSSIGLMTPAAVHFGEAEELYERRKLVLFEAYERNPERFVRKIPEPPQLPKEVWINPPEGAAVGCRGEFEGGGGKSAPSTSQSKKFYVKLDELVSQSC